MAERTLYFKLINEGMGGFLNPPGDAERTFCLASSYSGAIGPDSDRMALRYALTCEWVPDNVKADVRNLLAAHPGDVLDAAWQRSVYNYFPNCWSPDGVNRSASDCLSPPPLLARMQPLEHHLAYLHIKQYDPDHKPRPELIFRDWTETPAIEGELWARSPKQTEPTK